jgi:hypothetical protein
MFQSFWESLKEMAFRNKCPRDCDLDFIKPELGK